MKSKMESMVIKKITKKEATIKLNAFIQNIHHFRDKGLIIQCKLELPFAQDNIHSHQL